MSATELEKQSLEAHVDLCQHRYEQLEKRLDIVENKLELLHKKIDTNQQTMIKTIIATTGTVIATLLSTVMVMLNGGI